MTLTIVVPRRPVSVNQAYARAGFGRNRGPGGGKGFFMTEAGRSYKNAVRAYAAVAVRVAGWPPLESVRSVALTITTWNTRHDAAAAEKLTADALEGIVYANDRVIRRVTLEKARDGGKPRVEITVDLEQSEALLPFAERQA